MIKRLLAFLCCLFWFSCALAEEPASAPILELHQLDLGYADGYYMRCGDVEIMIDGGKALPFTSDDSALTSLQALGARDLDVYIVTHWHLDHCENINRILAAFGTPETQVFSPSEKLPTRIIKKKKKLKVTPLANGVYSQMKQGDVYTFGDLVLTCVGPASGGRSGKTNSDSLNFVVQYGRRRILFTGDYVASNNISKTYKELCSNVDVLKFPHHGGAPYEISKAAMKTMNPEYVIFSSDLAGGPIYRFIRQCGGHTQKKNIFSLQSGHITFLTDGADYFEVRTHQDPAAYAPAEAAPQP